MRQSSWAIVLIFILAGCVHHAEIKPPPESKNTPETKSNLEVKSRQDAKGATERKSSIDRKSSPESKSESATTEEPIPQLAELAGVYKNAGPYEYYLSNVIWGNAFPQMDSEGHPAHASVELIDLSASNNSLTAKAIQNGCIISVKTYVIGRDLDISDGQVVVHRNLRPAASTQETIAGSGHDRIALGIEANLPESSGPAVLYVMFAASDNRNVRFERVAGKGKGYKACDSR